MYYSLSWYDVNHKLQENYCVDVILSLETADDVNSKSFPLDSADIHMKAMLQSGKTKNAANTTSIYESKTRIVNIFYNPYREQPSQSEVKKSQGWLVSASRAAHFYESVCVSGYGQLELTAYKWLQRGEKWVSWKSVFASCISHFGVQICNYRR